MRMERQSGIESNININGCQVMLYFVPQSVDGVIENIQSILSDAYNERVQKELKSIMESKHLESSKDTA